MVWLTVCVGDWGGFVLEPWWPNSDGLREVDLCVVAATVVVAWQCAGERPCGLVSDPNQMPFGRG